MIIKKFKGMKNLVSDTKRTIEKLNMLGLTKFVTAVLNEEDVNESFLGELISSYDPIKKVARIEGRVVNVNKDALAFALHLRRPPPPDAVSNYPRFLYLFMTRFMLLNPRNADHELVLKVLAMKAHPERFDLAEFMWDLVEAEMLSNKWGFNQKFYYAQHLQRLIRSQHPDLFANPAMESKIEQIIENLEVQGFSMKRLESVSQANVIRYGLSPFVAAVMNEEILNGWILAELFATYDPKKKVARISGRVVKVNEDALADALHLPPDDMDLGNSPDYAEFLYAFVDKFMFLYVGGTKEVVQKMSDIKVHPERFDFSGFIWWFVENEILKGHSIKECYCGRHLQCLIRSQHPDLFVDLGVAKMDGTEMDDDDDDDDDDEFDDVFGVQEWSDIDDDDTDTDTDDDEFDDEFGDDTDDDVGVDQEWSDIDDDTDDDDDEFDDDDDEEEDEKAKQPEESQVSLDNTASSKKRLVDSPKEKQSSKRKQVEESKPRTSV